MVIQNYDRSYQVIRRMEGGEHGEEEYLCVLPPDQQYRIVSIRNPERAKRFMLFLQEYAENENFADYQESFLAEGKFYAVFAGSSGQALPDKLAGERCTLAERTEIYRQILEKLLSLAPHPFFAANVLRPENVRVSESLAVSFAYHLEGIDRAEGFTMRDVAGRLIQLSELLFEEELRKEMYPQLNRYQEQLAEGEGAYLEWYREFLNLSEALLSGDSQEAEPHSFPFRLWERMKKMFVYGKRVLMFALIAAAIIFVIFTFQDDSGSQVEQKTFEQIGTLDIK